MVLTRRIFQIIFFLFFLYLFIQARYPYEVTIQSDLLLRFSPLIPIFDLIQNFKISWIFLPGIIVLLLTPFLGRFFCSWICPLGTTLDLSSKILKSPDNAQSNRFHNYRYLKFAILLFTIILAFFGIHLWGYLDPLSILNRAFAVAIYPIVTLFTENTLLGISSILIFEDSAYFIYDLFKEVIMPEEQIFLQQVTAISIFFIVIFGLEKLSRRFWCRYLCPAGALLGFLSQFRLYERIVGNECPVCNKCQKECKMNAIPDEDLAYTDKIECIECFNCGSLCPLPQGWLYSIF